MKVQFALLVAGPLLCGALQVPGRVVMPKAAPGTACPGRRGAVAGALSAFFALPAFAEYTLPDLPYAYDALEPHIDAETMRFHHDKHHGTAASPRRPSTASLMPTHPCSPQPPPPAFPSLSLFSTATYVANVNKAVAGKPEKSLLELQKDAIAAGPGVRNSGGGHYNHALFWEEMAPASGSQPKGALLDKINDAFGSVDKMKEEFSTKAAGRFGSGWCWLGVKPDGSLAIDTTPNQDNPLMDGGCETKMIPILGLDVWEHAYYLKYKNARPEYIKAWFNVVDWDKVGEYYEKYAAKGEGVPF